MTETKQKQNTRLGGCQAVCTCGEESVHGNREDAIEWANTHHDGIMRKHFDWHTVEIREVVDVLRPTSDD